MRPTKTASRVLGLTTSILESTVRNLDNARRITNFLRGRMDFEVRPSDVFISSYPRSGTTLTQWILYLLTRADRPDPPHLTRVSPWFERSLAIGELTASDLNTLPSPRIFKSHLPRQWLPDGARYIYVEREGPDVLVSYFHFYRAYLGFEGTLDEFYRHFMRGRVQYGSWFDHIAGWHEHASDSDVLILRYESLLSDRRGCIEQMVNFLGWERNEQQIQRAVIESGFERMKRRESMFDHATALLLERGVKPQSFLRTGEVGQGRSALNEVQVRSLRETESKGRRLAIRGLAAFLQ